MACAGSGQWGLRPWLSDGVLMMFHEKLAIIMEQRGMTQSALGEMLGVTHRAVSGWLDGAKPHSRRRAALANCLGVSADTLFNDSLELVPAALSENSTKGNRGVSPILLKYDKLPLLAQSRVGRKVISCLVQALDDEAVHLADAEDSYLADTRAQAVLDGERTFSIEEIKRALGL